MTSGPAAVAETHSAAIFFLGDRAYKVKKPVDLGFLDFSTREAREAACQREVALNRRLAPDVYLGVADVHDPGGEVCDHLVVMQRMPPERRLATLVTAEEEVDNHLWHLAHLIAAFHSRAERSPEVDEAASRDALAQRWADSTETLAHLAAAASPPSPLDSDMIQHVHTLALRYLEGRQRLFERRIADGRACDGHGDLLADDIFCLDDGPRVLDCIEFDDRLRYGDTLSDVSFLAMDLERLGRPDLASRFLDAYGEHADDVWPASLAHHHVAYRAHVRAKVSAIRASQGDEASAEASKDLLHLALRHLEAGRVRLILVGGLPGTGKSTLALGLGDRLGATVLRSDEVRKELAGLSPADRAGAPLGEGIYAPEHTNRTYGAVLERAAVALELGETVVLDASWTDEAWRAQARDVAEQARADLVELRCEVPSAVAARRISERAERSALAATANRDPSDATPEIAAALTETESPWPTSRAVDTSGSPGQALATALEQIEQ